MPSESRLISDSLTGNTRPVLFTESGGGMMQLAGRASGPMGSELTPPTSGKTPQRSATPNTSPIIHRGGRQSFFTHQRKASNGGMERRGRGNSTLVDSLNLDTPLLLIGNSRTLPGRSSPSNSAHKTNSLVRKKPKGGGNVYQHKRVLDYDDVAFGLDKRASVRSDPGDRDRKEKKFRSFKHIGGSSHTSPTSSVISIAMDASQPVSIPHHTNAAEWDTSGSPSFNPGSDSSGKGSLPTTRAASLQGKTTKGRTSISKTNISLPKGPLYKDVVLPPHKDRVGVFLFQYSGVVGTQEGYYRQAEASIEVDVRPCLLFEQFDISTSDK